MNISCFRATALLAATVMANRGAIHAVSRSWTFFENIRVFFSP